MTQEEYKKELKALYGHAKEKNDTVLAFEILQVRYALESIAPSSVLTPREEALKRVAQVNGLSFH